MEQATEPNHITDNSPVTYYCRKRGYVAQVNIGEATYKMDGTYVDRRNHKEARFTPMGDFGVLTTSDPEIKRWIENQIAAGDQDFLTAAKYNYEITPAAVRERQAADEIESLRGRINEMSREISRKNELIEKHRGTKDRVAL